MLRRITIQEHERGFLFRRGRLICELDPGVHWVWGRVTSVSLARRQERVDTGGVLTRTGVPVGLAAVVSFRVTDPRHAVLDAEDHVAQLRVDAAAALSRTVAVRAPEELGGAREAIEHEAQGRLGLATSTYGLEVEDVWIEEVRLPRALRRKWKRGEAPVA